jgi:hypothetical protein
MAQIFELKEGIQQPLNAGAKREISEHLFKQNPTSRSYEDASWEPYYAYYKRQCSQWKHASITTHQGLIECTEQLKQAKRENIKQGLKSKISVSVDATEIETSVEGSLNLTARLLLMLDIGELSGAYSGRDLLMWQQGSLKDFVHQYFSEPPALDSSDIKLEKVFTARNLERLASLEVVWTDNLADHLRLTDSDKKVHIFHFATFLNAQRQK